MLVAGASSGIGLATAIAAAPPGLFDLLVGPLFSPAAQDRSDPVAARPGNVLAPAPDGHGLRGRQCNPVVGILRNLHHG